MGSPLGPVTELADDFALSTVVTNPLGGFVVVGTREADTHARRSGVWARRFAASGAPLGSSFVVELVDPELIVSPHAACDPLGRLYVTWGINSATMSPRGRAFDPTGRPLHASFRVTDGVGSSLLLAARPDGRFVEGRAIRDVVTRDLELQVRALCVPPHHTSCGDGVIQAPCERCDSGPANSDTTADACRTTCATATCGDGVIDHNETCDDGNLLGCDGCDSECNVEVGYVCGDGIVSDDCEEQCDDGGANDDTLPDACRTDCRRAHCGDDVLDTGEVCDDGNATSCDGCSDLCVAEPGLVCGDGIPEVLCGEQCDDGNAIVGDGCTEPCRLERVPGSGSPKTDCLTEWVVDNSTNVPRYDKNGAISGTQVCADNDPGCDFDGGVLGSCTFHMRVCANNTDLPECPVGSRLQSWQLRSPSAAKAAKKPALAAVRAAFTSVPSALLGPPLPDVCSGTLAVPVALRANLSGSKPGSLVLKSYATRYTGERDSDKIKLICTP
jgi:cysteine-rich repeat protein